MGMTVYVVELLRGPDGSDVFPDGVCAGYGLVYPFPLHSLGLNLTAEIETWLHERLGAPDHATYWLVYDRSVSHGYSVVWFMNPDHAMEFKLRWV